MDPEYIAAYNLTKTRLLDFLKSEFPDDKDKISVKARFATTT